MTVPNSFSGKAQATTLYADVTNVATSFTVTATSTWTETVGSHIGQPLGTSGPFVVTLDYGLSTEEKVLCSSITGSGPYTISVATGGRGYDGTSAVGHSAATAGPVVHTYSADVPNQANLGVTNAAAAQATADAATTTANAALPKSGGTMTGAINMNSQALTNLATSTTAQDAATYAQVSAVQTIANNSQIGSSSGYLAVKTTYPTLPQPLKVVGWTQSVAAASGGTAIAIPAGFTKVLLSIVGAYANEATVPGGYRIVIDTNGTNATDSFKAWIYNAAGTKQTSGSFTFSFMAIGY